jgi:hypothetical protein
MDASLPYSLHRVYGDAALPWLKKAARETTQPAVRKECAKELAIASQPAGFHFLLQSMDETPSFRPEVLQFMRDRFPDLRDADDERVLDFVRERAAAAR